MGVLVAILQQRTESLKDIFSSYNALHSVYRGVLASASVLDDKLALYDRTKKSAEAIEKGLSDSLHTQAFILMAGSVEALLKDLLEELILENFPKMNTIAGVSFSLHEMKNIIQKSEQDDSVSIKLAESVIRQLFDTKNAQEKINFQNTQSMEDIFRKLFGVQLDDKRELIDRIHILWQKRHTLVHSDGVVDKRFLHNVSKVGYSGEIEGNRIVMSKIDYDSAKHDFEELFDALEMKIAEKDLCIVGLHPTEEAV